MFSVSEEISIPMGEIEMHAIRAQGAGGQNVNKVSTAIHLRFNINDSSLPEHLKARLLQLKDNRITKEGLVVIKAQKHRSQDKNREDALERFRKIVLRAMVVRKKRKPTRPSQNARQRRINCKIQRGRLKLLRRKVRPEN